MKEKKDSKQEAQKSENVGTLGGLFGFPVTAVLRRLGKEAAHVRAIMAAKKIALSDSTLSIQVNAGRKKGYAGR